MSNLGFSTLLLGSPTLSDVIAALGYTPVNKAGDTMSGALVLPSNGLTVGTNQLVVYNGNIGIGTATPAYVVDIKRTDTSTGGGVRGHSTEVIFNPVSNATGANYATFASIDSTGVGASTITTMQGASVNAFHGGTNTCTSLIGSQIQSENKSTGTATNLRAVFSYARNTGGGTVATKICTYSYAQTSGTGSNTTLAYASYNFVQNTGTGVIANAYGLYSRISNTGSGTITNGFGLFIVQATAGVTVPWGIYQEGPADTNAFMAKCGFGLNAPQARIHIDSGTATASAVKFTAGSTTGQTSTDGFEVAITTTGEAEIRQREALDIVAYTNNAEVLRLKAAGNIVVPTTVTAAGTTGGRTINKVSGTVNIAAGVSAIAVGNSLVTANSIVICTIRTNDTTALLKNVVAGASTFTIRLNAAATAETSIGFMVFN